MTEKTEPILVHFTMSLAEAHQHIKNLELVAKSADPAGREASLDIPTLRLTSAWAPFHHRLFSAIWIATVVSSIGGWMSSAASAWLMDKPEA